MNNNKTFWRGVGDIVLYLIVFAVVQIVINIVGAMVWAQVKGEPTAQVIASMSTGTNPVLLALTSVFESMICLVLFLRLKWTPVSRTYLASNPWLTLLWVALFTLGTIIPAEFAYEQLGIKLSSDYEQLFRSLMQEPWGYVAVGIMAPLVEEIVFRGAILRKLLQLSGHHWRWAAIVVSAAIFGVVHGNTAQFVHAMILGVVLGWMYTRTRSIVPGILMHWVNNTVAYILTNLQPQSQGRLIDLFGGNQQTVYLALAFSLCILIPSLYQMIVRLRHA